MDLSLFRQIVNEARCQQASLPTDPLALCQFLGLDEHQQGPTPEEELSSRIRGAFSEGHQEVWRRCRALQEELIQDHVLEGRPLDPYFEVLSQMADAVRTVGTLVEEPVENWQVAIERTVLKAQLTNLNSAANSPRVFVESYMIARAAMSLRRAGFTIERAGSTITLQQEAEARFLAHLEAVVARLGGLNIIWRLFKKIAPSYDSEQERYQMVVPKGSIYQQPMAQFPFGYLFLLAVKHFDGGKSSTVSSDRDWDTLLGMITDYATILGVRDFARYPVYSIAPDRLAQTLQKIALSDSVYKIPQIRGSDVGKILRGVLADLDLEAPRGVGWSLNQALSVTDTILHLSKETRGPTTFHAKDIKRLCRSVPGEIVDLLLKNVLSHPSTGANQGFVRPTDAPSRTAGFEEIGQTFSQLPLLKMSGLRYCLADRAACAAAFIEALLNPLRSMDKHFDEKLGLAIERFVRAEFERHSISCLTGKYRIGREQGECDLVIETTDVIVFIEIKKKSLTRQAQAGSDLKVIADLAHSLLRAQEQAGWHELRLRRDGHLVLDDNGVKHRLELDGRRVERIALSFLDFGGFHDRAFLQRFMTSTLDAQFSAVDPQNQSELDQLNKSLLALRKQWPVLYSDESKKKPLFNCWFFSLPQLLVLLDDVEGAEQFKNKLWETRHINSGSADLYYDISYVKRLRATNTPFGELLTFAREEDTTFVL